MSHTLITVIAFVPAARVLSLRAAIEALGNPANPKLAGALDRIGRIHFASLNVFESSDGERGILVFEFSGDGSRDELLQAIDADPDLNQALAPIFAASQDRGSASLADFWTAHVVEVDQKLFANPGLTFSGTPGLSVERIRRERDLADHIESLLPKPVPATLAAPKLETIRKALKADPQWSWALDPEPLPEGRGDLPDVATILGGLAGPFARVFLWPLLPIAIVILVVVWWAFDFTAAGFVGALLLGLPLSLVAVALVVLAVYLALRRREQAEIPVDRAPDPGAVAAIMRRENRAAQNHLAALSVMKPGRLRRLTVVLAFWVIGQMAQRYYRPGFLADLGTIHFARWVMVPESGDLLFLSNYGGSWESYLEDFITKAHAGLTGVWSNTVGFPKASNLFQDGATDGERFKRWARRQQIPTGFWYSAYPDLTTAEIRANARIRQGLGAAMTEDEAQHWVSLFGSNARPPGTLESSEIQSLVLGGLGFLQEGMALVFEISTSVADAKSFLQELLPEISFADGRYHQVATIVGLSGSALAKFGLPPESIATFPAAFVDDMSAPCRARALVDIDDDAPELWWWGDRQSQSDGQPRQPFDGVLLLYARDQPDLLRQQTKITALLESHGHRVRHVIPFQPVPDRLDRHAPLEAVEPKFERGSAAEASTNAPGGAPKPYDPAQALINAKCEPFGFVDGISQPVIRGTYKALRGADPIHLVEAGEFILGYPDNRGHIPPSPMLAAIHDPANMLPVLSDPSPDFGTAVVNTDRDLGRNGSFLAVRQLQQDVDAFWRYCVEEGQRWHDSFPPGVGMPPEEFIAAKIVGRWRDGSPLVRYPRWPAQHAPMPSRPLMRSPGETAPQRPTVATIPASSAAIRPERLPRAEPTPPPQPQAAAAIQAGPGGPHTMREKPKPLFEPDNDFLLGAEDPQGLRCPFGAHIRRTNPRDSFDPGSRDQLDITNRHRIIRVGRFYQPNEQNGHTKGLFFMCLNGDLERQFEFLQQTWVQNLSFHGLGNERDPLIGSRTARNHHTIPTQAGPIRLEGLPAFVRTRGGGYFFLPGRRTLRYLAS